MTRLCRRGQGRIDDWAQSPGPAQPLPGAGLQPSGLPELAGLRYWRRHVWLTDCDRSWALQLCFSEAALGKRSPQAHSRRMANQPGAGSYSVIMQLDGTGSGTTAYPSLSCTDVLSGGPGAYNSRIVNNRSVPGGSSGCIDGIISVSVSGELELVGHGRIRRRDLDRCRSPVRLEGIF